MPRFPRGWGKAFHPQAARGANQLAYLPGYRGSGQQRTQQTPLSAYQQKASGIPLTGGQVSAVIPANGTLTLSVGPQGLGNTWYPVQVTISTTTGPTDTSTALVYLGSGQVPNQLVATVYSGNGTIALAIPSMAPGQTIIVNWTGAHSGDTGAVNIIGTMDALY
jgi:hypothetical protein